MNKKINEKIEEINKRNKIGFMGHVVAGFPDCDNSLNAALGICEGGADFIEIQFPFSDPPADGPVIEGACYEAIEKGFTVDRGFNLVSDLNGKTKTVAIIMTYANIIFKYGIENFIRKAKDSGAEGIIVPDLPVENDEGLNAICKTLGIANILLAAPGADEERIKKISGMGDGFLYTVARRGITGDISFMNEEAINWFELVKKNSSLPLAIGFGIRTKEQIIQLKDYCDIAIIGSHFVKIIKESYKEKKDLRKKMLEVTEDLLNLYYNT